MALDPNIQNAVSFGSRNTQKNKPCLALTSVDRSTAGLADLALNQLSRTGDASSVLTRDWKLETRP